MRRLRLRLPTGVPSNGGQLRCGTPYLIPWIYAAKLAEAWLEAIDAFVPPRWEDNMYAFGLAVLMLNLRVRRILLADTNYNPEAPVRAPVVHYCYDNDSWSKRRFATSRAARRVWYPQSPAKPGSILAEILLQLREARSFFHSRAG
jgi:hypothetical protein